MIDTMKTISDYTIYCTSEQTKKALELGAPLKSYTANGYVESDCAECPTAEQMIGFLEEQDIIYCIDILFEGKDDYSMCVSGDSFDVVEGGYSSRKEATLAAIDAALEYLSNKNNGI